MKDSFELLTEACDHMLSALEKLRIAALNFLR